MDTRSSRSDVPRSKPRERRTTRPPREPHRTAATATSGEAAAQSLYVANLPWRITAADIEQIFGRHGTVHQATVIADRTTGRSRGFGFVEMPSGAARAAIRELHGSTLDGRDLVVRVAEPKKTKNTKKRR